MVRADWIMGTFGRPWDRRPGLCMCRRVGIVLKSAPAGSGVVSLLRGITRAVGSWNSQHHACSKRIGARSRGGCTTVNISIPVSQRWALRPSLSCLRFQSVEGFAWRTTWVLVAPYCVAWCLCRRWEAMLGFEEARVASYWHPGFSGCTNETSRGCNSAR